MASLISSAPLHYREWIWTKHAQIRLAERTGASRQDVKRHQLRFAGGLSGYLGWSWRFRGRTYVLVTLPVSANRLLIVSVWKRGWWAYDQRTRLAELHSDADQA